MNDTEINLQKEKANLETSLIPWKDLQRFFAGGLTIVVAADLDLVEAAYQFSRDNKPKVQQWLRENKVGYVSDRQASEWYNADREVWAVVVKPWVLVQERS